MNESPHVSPFETIRKANENGSEYWSARDLYKLLGYSTWQKFHYAIEQAKIACENSQQAVSDHFNLQVNMIKAGKGAQRQVEDYQLTRYACYLIIQNANSPEEHTAAAARGRKAAPGTIATRLV